MDGFTKLIVSGAPSAVQMAKSLLTSPMLISLPTTNALGFAVPLEVEDHSQDINIEVSESLVIASDTKKNIADNVAPGSWSWSFQGYIPGISSLEPSNYFTPFVKMNTAFLKIAASKGYTLILKDIDCSIYKRVVIQSLSLPKEKDCANKQPFSMVLKEINVLDPAGQLSDLAQFGFSMLGGLIGDALNVGSTLAVKGTGAAVASLM